MNVLDFFLLVDEIICGVFQFFCELIEICCAKIWKCFQWIWNGIRRIWNHSPEAVGDASDGNEKRLPKKTKRLYRLLTTGRYEARYKTRYTQIDDLGEGMAVFKEEFSQRLKPRFLLNHNTKRAYEFMNKQEYLVTVTKDDIDWESLKDLPDKARTTAYALSFHYPSFILHFKNGVAEVHWQLNPSGYFYMDDDGYGMTDDEPVDIYGFIDAKGRVVSKFRNVKGNERAVMREEAEKRVKERLRRE